MSKLSNALLGAAIGAGGGFLAWHLTKDDDDKGKPAPGGGPTGPGAGGAAGPVSQPTATPPRASGPCSLKLDRTGLKLDGEAVTVATAVARCRAAGRGAEVAFQNDGPASVLAELTNALGTAGVPFTMKSA